MDLFITFFIKIFPLFMYVGMGWLMGKLLKVKKKDLADILVFLVLPLITFHGAFTLKISAQALSLPFLFFLLCSAITLFFLYLGKRLWRDNTGNLLAFASSYGNYGYFALPAAIALFGSEAEPIIIVAGLGFTIYSCTVGYFVTALGNFSVRQSFIKTVSLPSVYAFIIGFSLNYYGVRLGTFRNLDLNNLYLDIARDIRGGYSFFGMMLLGIAIAEIRRFIVDWKFLGMAMLAQFVVWPVVVLGIIMADKALLGFYPELIRKLIYLLSLIPIGINLVAYATQLDVQPDKAAVTILITTLFAMVYVPLMISLFIGLI